MGTYGDKAKEYFYKGYNCSQSVVAPFAQQMGLTVEQALCLSSGFGGGFGRLREVCGAFSGLVMVVSARYGSTDPAQKTATYAMVQELSRRYAAANGRGSIICRELLGLKQAEGSPVASPRTEEYYKKRPCPELVAIAADLAAEWLEEHPKD